ENFYRTIKACDTQANRSLSEVERAFFESVDVANHQDRNETKHAPEDRAALLDRVPVNDCPWIHKHYLEVEQDEEHCHDIELNAEARLPFALRNHPAFVRRVFRSGASSAFAYKDAEEQCRSSKKTDKNKLQSNRQ